MSGTTLISSIQTVNWRIKSESYCLFVNRYARWSSLPRSQQPGWHVLRKASRDELRRLTSSFPPSSSATVATATVSANFFSSSCSSIPEPTSTSSIDVRELLYALAAAADTLTTTLLLSSNRSRIIPLDGWSAGASFFSLVSCDNPLVTILLTFPPVKLKRRRYANDSTQPLVPADSYSFKSYCSCSCVPVVIDVPTTIGSSRLLSPSSSSSLNSL